LRQAIQVCRLRGGGGDCSAQEAQLKALVDAGPVKLKSTCAGAQPDGEAAATTPAEPAQPEGGAQ
jgi:hypothetical protein